MYLLTSRAVFKSRLVSLSLLVISCTNIEKKTDEKNVQKDMEVGGVKQDCPIWLQTTV